MKAIFLLLLFGGTSVCAAQHEAYRETARDVFLRATAGEAMSDSLLAASYPQSAEEYRVFRDVMREVPSVTGRDSLVTARIQSGSIVVLRAHLRYARFIEGDEAMWYVEEFDPMIHPVPFETVCEVTDEVVQEVGRERLRFIDGLIENCERTYPDR